MSVEELNKKAEEIGFLSSRQANHTRGLKISIVRSNAMKEELISKSLSQKDWDLINSALGGYIVTTVADCQENKNVMPKESYNRDMKESERLTYLVNVLLGKQEYQP